MSPDEFHDIVLSGFHPYRVRNKFQDLSLIHICKGKQGEKHVSSFQAFAISIASRVGTGNLAGVATAIAIGGPGAIFWMWVIALLGACLLYTSPLPTK